MGGGAPNDIECKMEGVGASSGEEEGNFASNMFLTSTGSYNTYRRRLPSSSNDSLGCDSLCEAAVEPFSNLRVDESVSASSASTGASATWMTEQDSTRAIRNASNTEKEPKKVTKVSLNSAGLVENPNPSDLLHGKCETSSVLEEGEPNFELEGYLENRLEQRNHETLGAVDESTVFLQKIILQNKLRHEKNEGIEFMREKIQRYRPGDGLLEVGGVSRMGFAVPKMTTLLLVGPSGAGKSTLINNLVRVLEKRTSGFDRAQVFEEKGDGSLFLQEYVFFEDAKPFSVFDSRGFSEKSIVDDLAVVRRWMTDGVCHGEPVSRPSDHQITKEELEGRGRQGHSHLSTKRRVDFAIFVVNAVTVHKMMESHDVTAIDNLVMLYKSPFLSFKDDRPAVVMTHGDKLSTKDRILTRIYIGKIFGVSPLDQVFDIACLTGRSVNPGEEDPINDLVLLNMLDFAMQRADRNLPYKNYAASWLEKAYAGIMCRWNELEPGPTTVLIAIFVTWLLCLALFLTAKGIVHHRHPWSLQDPLVRNILGKSRMKHFLVKKFAKAFRAAGW